MDSANMSSSKQDPQNKPSNATFLSLPLEIQQQILFHALPPRTSPINYLFPGPSGTLRQVCRAFRAALPAVERHWLRHNLKALQRRRDTTAIREREMSLQIRSGFHKVTKQASYEVRAARKYCDAAATSMEKLAAELKRHGRIKRNYLWELQARLVRMGKGKVRTTARRGGR